MSKSPPTSPRLPQSDHKCCEVVGQSVGEMQKRRRKPQPWVIRKIWILVTFGIMGYSGYAYIARLCLPMILRKKNALGSQTTGILLLVFFGILYLWMIWAYFTVILTAPGYARDHVNRTERPPLSDSSVSPYYGQSYQGVPPPSETVKSDSIEGQKLTPSETSQTQESTQSGAGPSFEHLRRSDSMSSHPVRAKEHNAVVPDAIVQPPLLSDNNPSTTPSAATEVPQNQPTPVMKDTRRSRKLRKQAARNSRLDELNIFRRPSPTPVLQPVFRYCDTDELVKPYRAHHCGNCGTCVLRYDHHCPWIGQCVGAQNHKFFLNFCFATSIFTSYVFPSVLFFFIKSLRTWEVEGIDPRFIVLLALAALFDIFTTALFASHVRLITHGQTTVESMYFKAMQDKDEDTLARGFAWWECRAKRKRRKAFDEEWGSLNTEGNIWWRGSAHEEWQDVMGKSWLGWIFPIGGGLNDGLSYPVNRRFDSDGRLRKRADWPKDLR